MIVLVAGFGKNHKVNIMCNNRKGCSKLNYLFLEIDPAKIGQGQPSELRTKWGEADQFGQGKTFSAIIDVKAFYN